MAVIPAPTNQTASTVNGIVSSVGQSIVTVVDAMILTDVPFLNTPVVKQLWEALFCWVAGYFIKAAQNGATFTVIDLQVNSEEGTLSKEIIALIAAEKSGDPDAIKTALQAYENANSALLHDDGSASV